MTAASVTGAVTLIVALGGSAVLPLDRSEYQGAQQDHVAWVGHVLKRMQTVTVGMSRADLLKVFMVEGGLSTGLQRTFVSRDCPYFKVDVEFRAVDHPSHDSDGRVTLAESSRDIIIKISRPYLQFSIAD